MLVILSYSFWLLWESLLKIYKYIKEKEKSVVHLRFGGYFSENLEEKYYHKPEFGNYILNNRDMFMEQITFVPQPAQVQKSKAFVLAQKSYLLLLIPSPFACIYVCIFCSKRQFINKICFFSIILSAVKCQMLYVLKQVQIDILHIMQTPDYFRNVYNHIKQNHSSYSCIHVSEDQM